MVCSPLIPAKLLHSWFSWLQEAVIVTISGDGISSHTFAPVAVQWYYEGISSAWLRKASKLSPWYFCISQEHPPFSLGLGALEAVGSQKISIFISWGLLLEKGNCIRNCHGCMNEVLKIRRGAELTGKGVSLCVLKGNVISKLLIKSLILMSWFRSCLFQGNQEEHSSCQGCGSTQVVQQEEFGTTGNPCPWDSSLCWSTQQL